MVVAAEVRLRDETRRLAELERRHKDAMTCATQRFDVTAMSDVGTLAMQTELSLSGLSVGSVGSDLEAGGGLLQDRTVDAKRRKLATKAASLEMELESRSAQLDSQMQTTAEQLATRKRQLLERERVIKEENRAAMETVSQQTDYIEQLEHKQV